MSRTDPTRRTAAIPRRRLFGLLAGIPAVVVTACTPKPDSGPGPTSRATSPSPTPAGRSPAAVTVTTKGITGGLADLARALYAGRQIRTTAATAVLKDRRPPSASELTVTGSQGSWHGVPIGLLSHGDDLTFAVQRGDDWTVVAGRWPALGIDQPCAGGRQFVLIIGSDAREQQGESISRSRGDSLHVCGVDGNGGAGVVGIPRDSWYDGNKINAQLVFGGPVAQTKGVAAITGLPITHYVLTGFLGFQSLVRAIGRVTVDSPGIPGRGIKKGVVHLAPARALQFARERYLLPNGDFGRSANQQRVLAGFVLAMKTFGPAGFGRLVTTADKLTESNLPAETALQYAAWAWMIKPARVGKAVASGGFGWRNGQSIVVLGSYAHSVFTDFADGNLSGH
ncbi:MAG: LCP family protein [Microlunatus sp.]|nr:LCP family protein [Microlunatus sp.]